MSWKTVFGSQLRTVDKPYSFQGMFEGRRPELSKPLREQTSGGWSLIGVLIGTAVGLIVLGLASRSYVQTTDQAVTTIQEAELQENLRQVIRFMVQDIRRAGMVDYTSGNFPRESYPNNPFWDGGNDLSRGAYNGENCILYSFDKNGNGEVDEEERFGFRVKTLGPKDVIQSRIQGQKGDGCDDGRWSTITDRSFDVKKLKIILNDDKKSITIDGKEKDLIKRSVDIAIEASTSKGVTKEFEASTQIRNHKIE